MHQKKCDPNKTGKRLPEQARDCILSRRDPAGTKNLRTGPELAFPRVPPLTYTNSGQNCPLGVLGLWAASDSMAIITPVKRLKPVNSDSAPQPVTILMYYYLFSELSNDKRYPIQHYHTAWTPSGMQTLKL